MRWFLSPTVRISVGLISMTVSIVLIAQMLGLVPDEAKSQLAARAQIAEALAVQLASSASRNDRPALEEIMKTVVDRNQEVLSIAVRKNDKTILLKSGDHEANWVETGDNRSTPTHVQVPLFDGDNTWGRVELVFKPIGDGKTILGMPKSFFAFLAFLSAAGFCIYFLMLRRVLRELDPSNVIPERVKAAFDTLAEGILILDQKGVIVLANSAFLRNIATPDVKLAGTAADNLNVSDWTTGKALQGGPWATVMRSGKPLSGTSLGIVTASGERRRFNVNVGPILDDKNNVRGAIATFDDATEIDLKNQELAIAVNQLQDFSSHLEDRVAERTAEAEQAVQDARDANEQLLAEVAERKRAQLAIQNQRDVLMRQQSALGALTNQGHLTGQDWQGSLHSLTETCARILDATRVGIWLGPDADGLVTCDDLFDAPRKRHNSELTLSEREFPNFFAALRSGTIIAAEDARNDLRTKELKARYLAPHSVGAVLCVPIIQDGVNAGFLSVEHVGLPRAWTPETQVFATAISNLASLAIESRQRWRVEENLRSSNAALEHANKAKSEFLANMSHEIRTPMNGVFGMTDLLMRTELSERQSRFVSTIQQSAKSLLVIINDILDISRIERGKLELDTHEFELGSCIEDAALLLADEAQKKGLDFNVYVDEDAMRTVQGDSGRLRQLLLNLVGNAIKFTSSGEVGISVRSTGQENGKTAYRFEIRDTGIGIAPEVLTRLFRPFEQADSSITRRFGGTGLGLSISRHLVGLMGGTLEIESTPGKGTRIWFTIPMGVTENKPSTSLSPARVIADQRFLVIDRREANREIISSYIAAAGGRVDRAESSEQALDMMRKASYLGDPYRLAIVELLDKSDASQRFEHIVRGEPGLDSVKFIMLASMSIDNDVRRKHEQRGARVLHKPLRRAELLDAAAALLSTRQSGGAPKQEIEVPQDSSELGLNVLVAEDNPVNQAVAEEYLANLGCTPVFADNGEIALQLAGEQKFDLILMDFQMPVMDGLTSAQKIRQRERELNLPAIPIIAVTANAFESDRTASAAAGMNDYLSKPYSEQQLAAILRKWGQRRDTVWTGVQPQAAPVRTAAAAVAERPAVAAEPKVRSSISIRKQPGLPAAASEQEPAARARTISLRKAPATAAVTPPAAAQPASVASAEPQAAAVSFAAVDMSLDFAEITPPAATLNLAGSPDEKAAMTEQPRADLDWPAVTEPEPERVTPQPEPIAAAPVEARRTLLPDRSRKLEQIVKPASSTTPDRVEMPDRSPMPERVPLRAPSATLQPKAEATPAAAATPQLRPARPGLRVRLTKIYLDYAPKAMLGLVSAIESADFASIKLLSHSLKSSSANVGADAMSSLCKDMEIAADAGDIKESQRLLESVQAQLEIDIGRMKAELELSASG